MMYITAQASKLGTSTAVHSTQCSGSWKTTSLRYGISIVLNATSCVHLSLPPIPSLPTIKIPYKSHRPYESTWGTQAMAVGQ